MAAFKKVLFIDDDAITVSISQRLMQLVDFTTEFVSQKDGLQAIDYLTGNMEALPDIIFVDLYMQAMDGRKFIEWFTSWSQEAGINISLYVLSSSLDNEFTAGIHAAAVTGYFMKPLTAENLTAIGAGSSA
jgi:CheY-like chemotaxis protein